MARELSRFLVLAALAGALAAQKRVEPVEPPEEDEEAAPKEYSFNPLQAQKEYTVGNFYFKKQSWRAAAGRYVEAVKWNPGYADAWMRLGETREKMKDAEGARQAYKKFLDLAPEDKRAAGVKRRLAALKE